MIFHTTVTGSSKGIGKATALEFLHLGASVVVMSRSKSDVGALCALWEKDFPGKVFGCAADVSKAEGRADLVSFVTKLWGGELDILINNVGTNVRKSIQDQTEEEYRNMMTTNVDSCYFLCKALHPFLLKGAKKADYAAVVNISSTAGVTSTGTGAVYAMSKAAMVQLTKNLACEWGSSGIRVNACAPWMTFTPLLAEAIKEDPKQLDKPKEWTPLQVCGNHA